MTSRTQGIMQNTEGDTGARPESLQTSTSVRYEQQRGRSESSEDIVAEIRLLYGSDSDFLSLWEDAIRRWIGLSPASLGAAALAFSMHSGIRLSIAVLATAFFGEWSAVPWGRWLAIVTVFGLIAAVWAYMRPPLDDSSRPELWRIIEDWTAMVPAITRESDLRDLARLTRRWMRTSMSVAAGVAVASMMLFVSLVYAPVALRTLPIGSTVLLFLVLYEFGATVVFWGNLFNRAFMARESRYEHRLYWPSPADSLEVRKVMRKTSSQAFIAGWWITVFLVMSVVLVGWSSPLVLPLALGFVTIGYLTTIGLAISNRASVRVIVERSRQQAIGTLRQRIDVFESRLVELAPQEAEELERLLSLHDRIRDAPSSPAATHAIASTAAGLLLPTIAFIITVFGEVSAERLLDAILP